MKIKYPNRGKRNTYIVLSSRKTKRVEKLGFCFRCGCESTLFWQIETCNVGCVNVCKACKSKVLDESFGKVDVMQTRPVSAGCVRPR